MVVKDLTENYRDFMRRRNPHYRRPPTIIREMIGFLGASIHTLLAYVGLGKTPIIQVEIPEGMSIEEHYGRLEGIAELGVMLRDTKIDSVAIDNSINDVRFEDSNILTSILDRLILLVIKIDEMLR